MHEVETWVEAMRYRTWVWMVAAVLVSVYLGHASAVAVEVTATLDRNSITVGGAAHVQVVVRQTWRRPTIYPPEVPDCRIEPVGSIQPVQRGTTRSSRTRSRRGVRGAPGRLTEVIGELERTLQESIREQGRLLEDMNPVLTREHRDLLRSTADTSTGVGSARRSKRLRRRLPRRSLTIRGPDPAGFPGPNRRKHVPDPSAGTDGLGFGVGEAIPAEPQPSRAVLFKQSGTVGKAG